MIFATDRSKYEIDTDRIRRLSGERPPTPRQAPDGEWQPILWATPIAVGRPIYVALRVMEDESGYEGYEISTVRSIEQ